MIPQGIPKRKWDVSFVSDIPKKLYLPSKIRGPLSLRSLESIIREDLDQVADGPTREFGKLALQLLIRRLKDLGQLPNIFNKDMLSLMVVSSSKMELCPTSYHSFLLTNYLADEPEWHRWVDECWPGRVESCETPLGDSIRANPLSVHLNLVREIDDDYHVLISCRGGDNTNAPNAWGHTAGGSVDIEDVCDYGNEALERAATRELREELDIEIPLQNLSVVDFFVSSKVLDPVVVALAVVPDGQSTKWTLGEEVQSATWCKIADVQRNAQLTPQDWHYDTLDDMTMTVNALGRGPI